MALEEPLSMNRPHRFGGHLGDGLFVLCGMAVASLGFLSQTTNSGKAFPAEQANSPMATGAFFDRVPWTGSKIQGSPEPPPPFRIERAFPKLSFRNPLHLSQPPGQAPGLERFFVCEQGGKILSFRTDDGVGQADVAIDLPKELTGYDKAKVGGVGDLYALAFHPQFQKNRFCYLCYVLNSKTANPLADGSRVSRFRMTETVPPRIDPTSEKVLITWLGGGHNGCDLHFGPDGFLYISTGDAASPNPPDSFNTGQDISDLLSSVLRIDVDREEKSQAYAVPTDNPFVKLQGARPEVWAYGFRNPWRMSFDRKTGDLWVGDVGWEQWEMIYRVKKGGNYGWPIMEGPQSVRSDCAIGPTPISPPALALPHSESASITGGFVYRGQKYPEWQGTYIFGDWVSGKIWGTRFDGDKVVSHRELAQTTQRIVAFGEDQNQELYLLDHAESGFIYRLVPNEAARDWQPHFPKLLSQTGLFSSVKEHALAEGVVPFSIHAEMWADNASAVRFLALPGKSIARMYDRSPPWPNNSGEVQFPVNGVVGKTLSLEMNQGNPQSRRRVETQLLHWDGFFWKGYSYAWNQDGTDAVLVEARGATRTLEVVRSDFPGKTQKQAWHYPSRTECLTCHNSWSGFTLAFNPAQLNKPHDFGAGVSDQLVQLEKAQYIQFLQLGGNGTPDKPRAIPSDRLTNPHDRSQKLEDRARSYLHINCSHCHQFGAGGTAMIDLRAKNKLEETNLIAAKPLQGAFDIPGGQIVVKGEPHRSILYYRLAKSGPGHMPHIGSELIDREGLRLIHDWIAALPSGPKQTGASDAQSPIGELDKLAKQPARQEAIKKCLSDPSGALTLVDAIDSGRLSSSLQSEILAMAAEQANPGVRDLFERFLPEEQRVKRLGQQIPVPLLLQGKGRAQRGQKLFFQTQGTQCANCHRVAGKGIALGPDLDGIGKKYTRAQILESLLDPSKTVDPKYAAFLVETDNGKVHTGLLLAKTDKEVVLKTIANQEVRIPASQIVSLLPQKKSLMPEQILRDLSLEQALDLLEFLTSLK